MRSILAISAHPDDESLFAGGTLAMYAKRGHDVYILETTRGEGGEVGEPPLTTKENLGAYREQEVRKAARALGVRDIFFLPFLFRMGSTQRVVGTLFLDLCHPRPLLLAPLSFQFSPPFHEGGRTLVSC